MDDRRERILEAAAGCIARSGVRGLRVQEVAREAGVSTGLLYYHFTDRTGLLAASLAHVSDRAARYADVDAVPATLDGVRQVLMDEIQDRPDVVENSSAWSELRASAIFETDLRSQLAEATREWIEVVAETIAEAQREGLIPADRDPIEAAGALTALVEGLSNRWLSGSITLDEARSLLTVVLNRLLS